MYKVKPKNIKVQFDVVDRDSTPFAIIVGSTELEQGTVRIKEQWMMPELIEQEKAAFKDGEKDGNGTLVERTEMVKFLRERLALRG